MHLEQYKQQNIYDIENLPAEMAIEENTSGTNCATEALMYCAAKRNYLKAFNIQFNVDVFESDS